MRAHTRARAGKRDYCKYTKPLSSKCRGARKPQEPRTHLHGLLDRPEDRRPRVLDALHGGGLRLAHEVEGLEGGYVVGYDDRRVFLVGALPLNLW